MDNNTLWLVPSSYYHLSGTKVCSFYRCVDKEAFSSYPTDVIYRPSLEPGTKFTFRVEQGEMDDEVDVKI